MNPFRTPLDWLFFGFLVGAVGVALFAAFFGDAVFWQPVMKVVAYLVAASVFVNLFRYVRSILALQDQGVR